MSDVPHYDDITLAQFDADPYPTYAKLRAEAPVAWLAPARINLVTKFDDIMRIERDHETFPALDMRSLQIKAMGHSLMRRDGPPHARQRKALEPTFSPVTAKNHWGPIFQQIADGLIDGFAERGKVDLFTEYAAPLASRSLKAILGLPSVDWRDLCVWSQALMDATGNYGDDPEIWGRGKAAYTAIDQAIEERLPQLRAAPDKSALSSMLHADDPLSLEDIRANTKVIIGGGLNEPRDATCTMVMGLLSDPEQLAWFKEETAARWKPAFEEAVRWIAPIGMYPRRVAKRVEIGGTVLHEDDAIGLSVASACRDEDYFEQGDMYNVHRPRASHLAFGAGPHFCLGTWLARKQVGEIGVPRLLARLPGLRLDPEHAVKMGGWVFRGALNMPVVWDV
ncbi:MAG: cytochrome P450 [Sulfitobacter sp.]